MLAAAVFTLGMSDLETFLEKPTPFGGSIGSLSLAAWHFIAKPYAMLSHLFIK